MHALIILALLTLASLAQAEQLTQHVEVIHDNKRAVTCWIYAAGHAGGISCLPDDQLRDVDAQAEGLRPDGPTPARSPAPRQHREAFQL